MADRRRCGFLRMLSDVLKSLGYWTRSRACMKNASNQIADSRHFAIGANGVALDTD